MDDDWKEYENDELIPEHLLWLAIGNVERVCDVEQSQGNWQVVFEDLWLGSVLFDKFPIVAQFLIGLISILY